MVGNVVERQIAANQVEVPRQFRQGAAQVGYPVVNGATWVLPPSHLDEAGREVDAGHARAAGGQDAGQESLAAAGVEHLAPGEIAQEFQQAGEDGIALQAGLLAPGDPLGILRRVLVPLIGIRPHEPLLLVAS